MPPDSWTNFDFDEDPTDFEGLSPLPYGEKTGHQNPSRAASLAHGTSAAGARAFTTQLIAFYFRAPVWKPKLHLGTRIAFWIDWRWVSGLTG